MNSYIDFYLLLASLVGYFKRTERYLINVLTVVKKAEDSVLNILLVYVE